MRLQNVCYVIVQRLAARSVATALPVAVIPAYCTRALLFTAPPKVLPFKKGCRLEQICYRASVRRLGTRIGQ